MSTATTQKATVGVFPTRGAAERAIADLKTAGYRDDQIGLVAKDEAGKTVRTDGGGETNAGEGLTIGAVAGAATGAAVGLGVLAGVIPVVGPAIMAGTLGTILTNALGGAAIAGIAGALVGWGIPEDEAKYYEGEVQAGRYLVTVETGGRADVRGLLARHGGYDRASAGQTVRLQEEQLRVNKNAVKTGDVEVRKEVHTEHQQFSVPVEREEVVIERHPVRGAAGGDIKAEQIRIPVKEERVHVSKEAVVTEEVSVGKRKVQDTQTVSGDVRKEKLVVETDGQANVRQTSKPGKS